MSGVVRIGCKTAQVRQSRWLSGIAGGEKALPLPLREGDGGRGETDGHCVKPLPPTPSLKGRGSVSSSAVSAFEHPNPQSRCPA